MPWAAEKPFLTRTAIARWKAQFPYWPPKKASPVTPIEPWGKQFFVYNAPRGVEFRGDPRAPPLDGTRPPWVRDEDAASMLQEGEDLSLIGPDRSKQLGVVARRLESREAEAALHTETVLCCTDFRQRPLMYLRPAEWAELLKQLPVLRAQLRRCQQEVDALDQHGEVMKDHWLRRRHVVDKYEGRRIGNMNYGKHVGRSYETGKIPPKTRERKIKIAERYMQAEKLLKAEESSRR